MRLLRYFLPQKGPHSFKLDKEVVHEAAQRFGINARNLVPVRNSMVHVYANSGQSFLKIIPENYHSNTTLSQICLWQNFLHSELNEIVPLLPSSDGLLAEKIEHKTSAYSALLYEKANGVSVTSENWHPDIFFKIGKLAGSIHRVSKDYSVSEKANDIPDWNPGVIQLIEEQHPKSDATIRQRLTSIFDKIQYYSKSITSYGIIHNDIHRGNLKMNNNSLKLFDFDEACFSWFANDVANIFYNALLNTEKSPIESLTFMEVFKHYFWKGYNEENRLDDEQLNSIPLWLALRALNNHAYLTKIGEHKNTNPTLRNYFLRNQKFANEELEKLEPRLFY